MILGLLLMATAHCVIQLYHLQMTTTPISITMPFTASFTSYPSLAVFIETAKLYSNEFSLTYTLQSMSLTSITLDITLQQGSIMMATESVTVGMLLSNEDSSTLAIGTSPVALGPLISVGLGNFTTSSLTKCEVYSLSFPLVESSRVVFTNYIEISATRWATAYVSGSYFSYICFSNIYVGEGVATLFQEINATYYDFFVPYYNFAYSPSSLNVLMMLKHYDSLTVPFINAGLIQRYNAMLQVGYTFPSGVPVDFHADAFLFNSSFEGCPEGQFLFYPILFQALPSGCIPCNSKCSWCAPISPFNPFLTDANSCLSCPWLRYMQTSPVGQCFCYIGIEQINGECQDCQSSCLRFNVVFVESTDQAMFLLYYSYGDAIEQVQLASNLKIKVNGKSVNFTTEQQAQAVYQLKISLQDMDSCEGSECKLYFLYTFPNKVLKSDLSQSLTNNNLTLYVTNFINYYSQIPSELQSAFAVLSMVISGTYSGGYSGLVKLLFELEQLIDAHKYLNLTIPVVFNQLLDSLLYFRFMDITSLLPQQFSTAIIGLSSNELDNLGPAKLMYYENGLNFYKNIIAAIFSCTAMLLLNFFIYTTCRLLPFRPTRRLARKIAIRRIVTVHDTLQQLQLPVIFFAIAQFQTILLHSNLVWVYGMAMLLSFCALSAPFLVVIYIYSQRQKVDRVDVYEDLLQDNAMSQPVTYIYYVFNYYRKVFFALSLSQWVPGLIQLYLLLTLNLIHLAFQIYLVVSKVFRSRIKIVIRFINSLCILALQFLILLYNLQSHDSPTMITIGLSCLYLALTTTILGVFDVLIKLFDTCCQQVKKHQKEAQEEPLPKIIPGFRNDLRCNIGDPLREQPPDPQQRKFIDDKQLMENTFQNKQEQSQSAKSDLGDVHDVAINSQDLVFIDEDWAEVFPIPKRARAKRQQEAVQLYEISKEIDEDVHIANMRRKQKKINKYEVDLPRHAKDDIRIKKEHTDDQGIKMQEKHQQEHNEFQDDPNFNDSESYSQ